MTSFLARTSIVVPLMDEAGFLADALGSLVAQDYPNLEVVIQDGGSTDGSIDLAGDMVRRYPEVFRLFVEKDLGYGEALERGFSRAGGTILSCLGADDFLLPGVLRRVAAEFSPEGARQVVVGRTAFVVDEMPGVTVGHGGEYLGHFDHLAIWGKGFNSLALSSAFWHRSVSASCGAFAAGAPYEVAYDWICRVGGRFTTHKVDEPWSACRVRRTASPLSDAERLESLVRISRGHWGSPLAPLHWRCAASYWQYQRQPHEHARHHARQAEHAIAHGQMLEARLQLAKSWVYSPGLARGRLGGRIGRRAGS